MLACMPALQIRDLPAAVHRTLKSRAAERGQSLSDYAGEVLSRSAERPTLAELTARVRARGAAGDVGAGEIARRIRRERGSR